MAAAAMPVTASPPSSGLTAAPPAVSRPASSAALGDWTSTSWPVLDTNSAVEVSASSLPRPMTMR